MSSPYPAIRFPLLPACLVLLALIGGLATAGAQNLAQRWLKIYSNPLGDDNGAKAVAIDPKGDVIMTGSSKYDASVNRVYGIRTAKYSGNTGDMIWERKTAPPGAVGDTVHAMALDSKGDVIVAGSRLYGYYIEKYSGIDGSVTWTREMRDGPYSLFTCMKVDAQDNVVASGSRRLEDVLPIPANIETHKFNGSNGDTIWKNIYDARPSLLSSYDSARDMALDENGDVFVTGWASFGQYEECVTLKISGATGTSLWIKQRRDNGTSGSSGEAIAVDQNGNCFVASTTPQGFGGLRVVKYRGTDGAEQWVNIQDGPQRDEPSDIAIDPAGNAVVTGYTYDVNRQRDIFTRKVNGANGQTAWTRTYDGGITSLGLDRDDLGDSVAFDRNGNPVIAGSSNNASGNGPDPMILRYASTDGTSLQTQRITMSPGDNYPGGMHSLAVGPGHVTLVGSAYARYGRNGFILRLNDPAPPTVTTLPATNVAGGSATLNGSVNPNGRNIPGGGASYTRFHYGNSPEALTNRTEQQITGNGFTSLLRTATLAGLPSGQTYYYQFRMESGSDVFSGEILSFQTPSNNARLSSPGLSAGELTPAFAANISDYGTTLSFSTATLLVTPVTEHPRATVTVNGIASTGGGVPVQPPVGSSTIVIEVTAEDGIATLSYQIHVTRLPEEFVFRSASDIPLKASGFATGGFPAVIRLEYAPLPGTDLTMVENSGRDFIRGRFANLAQGQKVTLTYGGTSYDFVANYYGGSGNDLVLHWADTTLAGWGAADQGQLGNPSERGNLPAPAGIDLGAISAGHTIFATAAGYSHSLCLFSDGKVAAWGYNVYGQAGRSPAGPVAFPAALLDSGALQNKRVIAIAAGAFHSLALCEDGSIAAWGYNNHGQLGNGGSHSSATPVAVDAGGALAGKTVVAIAAGAYHCLALCSDGTIVGWGFNGTGCLGNGGTIGSKTPVITEPLPDGAAAAVAIAAGDYHSFALTADGKVAAWGANSRGQLGDGSTVLRASPVLLGSGGALAGRSAVAISGGGLHGLALCSDGTLVAWGAAGRCGLAEGSTTDHPTPVAVDVPEGTAGLIDAISAAAEHSHARLKDGRIIFWGHASRSQAGDGTSLQRGRPVFLPAQSFASFTALSRGSSAYHTVAIVPAAAVPGSGVVQSGTGVSAHEQAWWSLHFGSDTAAIGESDLADPDRDGIPNLIEYAFGQDPHESSPGSLPQWRREGNEMVLRFTVAEGVTSLHFGVIAADRPDATEWGEIQDIGTFPEHHFRVAMEAPSRFMRLQISRR